MCETIVVGLTRIAAQYVLDAGDDAIALGMQRDRRWSLAPTQRLAQACERAYATDAETHVRSAVSQKAREGPTRAGWGEGGEGWGWAWGGYGGGGGS